eukprot:5373330-Prymnesium_polylepis.1
MWSRRHFSRRRKRTECQASCSPLPLARQTAKRRLSSGTARAKMPATAGRVRMPANNRMQTSASLNTHGIWQNAI